MITLKKSVFVLVAAIAGSTAFGLLNRGAAEAPLTRDEKLEKIGKPNDNQATRAQAKQQNDDIASQTKLMREALSSALNDYYEKTFKTQIGALKDSKMAKEKGKYVVGYYRVEDYEKKPEVRAFFVSTQKAIDNHSANLEKYMALHGHDKEKYKGKALYGVLFSDGSVQWKERKEMPKPKRQETAPSGDEVTADDLKYGGAAW